MVALMLYVDIRVFYAVSMVLKVVSKLSPRYSWPLLQYIILVVTRVFLCSCYVVQIGFQMVARML